MARNLESRQPKSYAGSIPDEFLKSPPSLPLKINHIDFVSSAIPENAECLALTIDNILSKSECERLISLAESSVSDIGDESPWKPATINVGHGVQATVRDYRHCDRIEWNHQSIVDRIWDRCTHAPGLRNLLAEVVPEGSFDGQRWEFRRFNQHMRFLRYEPGQFFKPHCDNPIWYEYKRAEFQTHYTAMLYLNDATTEEGGRESLKGGVTSFLSPDRERKVNVSPKAGSVLIFQQRGLLHEGAVVESGVKYAMRMDMVYEWVDGSQDANKRVRV
ncbi:unnamed protein product [Clonostachys rosea]|uniref:Prolyl 4-hydroxylase alpha subunit domain-containing protein n=1 Tax=Bionectria ochroleuca TaxID=29856 RepID=A0ABY6U6W9_BIOOC|nr:unnamed protein product [Clonostachys rosea]